MYPLSLNLNGRCTAVIGGGAVGRRKAASLLGAGALVRLVCLEPRPPEETSSLDWRTEPYRPEHLEGTALVFAAATPAVNRQVVADAQARRIWVNSATEPEAGDFFTPAVVRRGDWTLAISTGGAAPALAHEVRRRLETEFDEVFGQWVGLLAEFRPIVLAEVAHPDQRRVLFERLCQWSWLDRLRREGIESLRCAMRAEVAALACSPHPSI